MGPAKWAGVSLGCCLSGLEELASQMVEPGSQRGKAGHPHRGKAKQVPLGGRQESLEQSACQPELGLAVGGSRSTPPCVVNCELFNLPRP